ncbi:MAG: hypothetical protein GHCLOJNM_03038 [bacterium]|nr:hypothetical protein [bacterium]
MASNGRKNERVRITRISARNFKLLRELDLAPDGDVTVIQGESGQGKSTVLQLLQAAFRGADPEVITKGKDEASVFLSFDDGTQLERVIRNDGEGKLMVTQRGLALKPQEAKAFVKALTGEGVFDPIKWVQLGGGEGDGKTERRRRQRDELLRAMPMELSPAEVVQAIRDLGEDAKSIAELINMPEQLFSNHALVVCDTLGKTAYEVRTFVNREVAEREEDVKRTPPVEGEVPSEPLAEIEEAEAQALQAYHNALGAVSARQATVDRAAKLKGGLVAKRELLATLDAKPVNLEEIETKLLAGQTRIVEHEEAIRQLQKQIDHHREGIRVEEGHAVVLKANRATQMRVVQERDSLRASIEADAAEIEGIEASLGSTVANPDEAKARFDSIKAYREKREKQDRHEAAVAQWKVANAKSEALTKIVELFRDELPKRILARAKAPIDGLGLEGETLTINGIPLHQKGNSEQIRIGVQVAVALSPNAGFVCVDRLECMGQADRKALYAACKEFGVQILATEVITDREDGVGTRVMMEGGVAKVAA